MSIEELLLPRYKVTADYPDSEFQVGEILLQCKDGIRLVSLTRNMYIDWFKIDKYPHLFKKLEWWEERDLYKEEVEKEVIEIVPYLKSNGKLHGNEVYKVERFTASMFGYMSGVRDAFVSTEPDGYGKTTFELRWFEPATEAEYAAFKSKTTPNE